MTTILVIEDSDITRQIIKQMLYTAGYEVLEATDGVLGIQIAKRRLPDLIICDISMPSLDGFGVLKALRSFEPCSTTPFIFVTAFEEREKMRQGMELGADDYLTKPFSPAELRKAVRMQLAKKNRIAELSEEKLNRLRQNIATALPHEFRTPLMLIHGYTHLLLEEAETMDEQHAQMINEINSAVDRLKTLIERFWTYAEIELMISDGQRVDGRAVLTEKSASVVRGVARQVAARYQRESDLDMELSDVALRMLPEDLERIITELLDNALKFSKPGSPVKILGDTEDKVIVYYITDYGRGMTSGQLNDIGAYMQFDRNVLEQKGVGLGLVIAARLVELHGGRLTIESSLGSGTSVIFTVPLA